VRRSPATAAVIAVAALLLAGCSAASTSPATTVTGTAAAAGCVADPQRLVSASVPQPGTALPDALSAQVDAAVTSALAQTSASGAMVGIQTPEGRLVRAYGVADPATGRPMTPDEHQRIGSVTKTFTGTLVDQLAQQGRLSLDDTIDRYVSGVPNGSQITLRMLITMTSGLASYTLSEDVVSQWFADPAASWTPEQLLQDAFALPPLFPPGQRFDYSNTNFVLLGVVIEKVTGKPYATVLQEQILQPLGLSQTSMQAGTEFPEPHAVGTSLQGVPEGSHTPLNATDWNASFTWAAGGMVSTVPDLLVYGRALASGQGLLDPQTQLQRLEAFPSPAGYGQGLGCIDGWIGHTGELPGYTTTLFYDTTSDTTVVVATNTDIASGSCTVSPTMSPNPSDGPCMGSAVRVFTALSTVLGHTFTPNPMS